MAVIDIKTSFKVRAPVDFNTRVVSIFVNQLNKIEVDFYISVNGVNRRVQGLSKLGILSLCIKKDDILNIDIFHKNENKLERDKKAIIDAFMSIERW